MEDNQKIIVMFCCFAYIVDIIGAVGYLAYIGQYVIMVSVIVIAAIAAPTMWRLFKELI